MMVDTANSKTNYKSLKYAAALDVSAAFDTVPFSALEQSMTSLKFPPQLQQLIKNLIVNEKRVINTIHGDTKSFHPRNWTPTRREAITTSLDHILPASPRTTTNSHKWIQTTSNARKGHRNSICR